MEDQDIGEMFLNFNLHPLVQRFAAIDLALLELSERTCPHQHMCWTRNLMGFKPSPYNLVCTYLVAKDVIRGDRHNPSNPFQWDYVKLNLPGTWDYNPSQAWISKRRLDGTLASNFVCFVDDQQITGQGQDRVIAAGHAINSIENYLGIQDALRKLRAAGGTRRPGAWAGASVFNEENVGVVMLTSQEKWDRLKEICQHWHAVIQGGETMLDYKKLLLDRGFLVYITQAYPSMKPYLKGFHLSLETWRGNCDAEGWKKRNNSPMDNEWEKGTACSLEDVKLQALCQDAGDLSSYCKEPPSGKMTVLPRFKQDLEALLLLTKSKHPTMRRMRSNLVVTAYYGFSNASSGRFGLTVEYSNGLHGRFGLWGSDTEDESLNYRELPNLVKMVEEEALNGHLSNLELWIFTDNSTVESCFLEKLFIYLVLAKPALPGQFVLFCVIPKQGKYVEIFLFVPMHSTK
jgi:hypothetical protein